MSKTLGMFCMMFVLLACVARCVSAAEVYVVQSGHTQLFTGTITHYEEGLRGAITIEATEYIIGDTNDRIFKTNGDEIWWQWWVATSAGWVQGAARCSHSSNLRNDVIILDCQ